MVKDRGFWGQLQYSKVHGHDGIIRGRTEVYHKFCTTWIYLGAAWCLLYSPQVTWPCKYLAPLANIFQKEGKKEKKKDYEKDTFQ